MPLVFTTAQATPRRDGRTQDRLVVREHATGLVVGLADGTGGIPGGDLAAEVFVRGVSRASHDVSALSVLLKELDAEIERAPLAGETTGVIVVVTNDAVIGASCGDSGAWIVRDDGYDDLTADQKTKPRLGSGRAVPVAFERGPLDGTLLVASDGLFPYAQPDVLCASARILELRAAADALIASVRTKAGRLIDDVSVALVRGAARTESDSWAAGSRGRGLRSTPPSAIGLPRDRAPRGPCAGSA